MAKHIQSLQIQEASLLHPGLQATLARWAAVEAPIFKEEFVDANALDRSRRLGRFLLGLPVQIVVKPSGQSPLGHTIDIANVGDVREVNQTSDMSEEPNGRLRSRGQRVTVWGEKPLTKKTFILRHAQDQLDRSVTDGEIFAGIGSVTSMDRFTETATVRTAPISWTATKVKRRESSGMPWTRWTTRKSGKFRVLLQ